MRYINTIKNIKAIMDYNPQLIEFKHIEFEPMACYEKQLEPVNIYRYKDINFWLELDVSKSGLNIHISDKINNLYCVLHYDKEYDNSWKLTKSIRLKNISTTNKLLRAAARLIKSNKYNPDKAIEV